MLLVLGLTSLRWVIMLLLILSVSSSSSSSSSSLPRRREEEAAAGVCSQADRAALLSFRVRIVKDTTDILSSWTGTDCCAGGWEGVECNPAGRVTVLQLQSPANRGYMKGTLSPSLGNLNFLEVMVISGLKQITGPIPDTFSNLAHLTQLALEDNSLQGIIPSGLGRLSSLQSLTVAGNRFRGQIPPSLGRLTNLVQLNLARNFLTGPIPTTFQNFHALQYLDLSFNMLSGLIPSFVGQHLHNLTFIDLSNNQFSGQMPISLFSLPNLLDLSLDHNQLTGIIPVQVGGLKSLTSLSLSNNHLNGHIPASISSLQNLWHLNLSRNGFSSPLPETFARGIPSLLSIDLSYNNLSLGTVPDWIRSRQLRDVHLAGCQLRGTLPSFTKPESLNSIDLSHNQFTDGISKLNLTSMSSLQSLKLSNNQLKFDLSEIKLPDTISLVDLHSNQLLGSLSRILSNRGSSFSFLEVLDVSNNQISGGIPEFRQGLRLKVVNIGSNKIASHIPISVSNLIQLERFDISRNQITGTIPTSLGLLGKLQWLDLSINGLTGKIPTSLLGIQGLRHASFRANKLCGEIPEGRPFNIFPAAAYLHNLCLCGKPLPPCRGKNQNNKQRRMTPEIEMSQ
ncbi:MDIS1-interacting receptor like kinase 2-like [Rosa rugosa]|uniref:MDIS1-interacting receptor like kinase 2-like n=1 Tax=Rosa rugosa TaxID=74645 RepID=UPI002B40F28B|nr:MDIS1-interacting receptor like kinase 2-like [Rosa rugosa]XP_061994713.1 MDIS1-interacting receptor like kinase 2-like [Rosa rugosa]